MDRFTFLETVSDEIVALSGLEMFSLGVNETSLIRASQTHLRFGEPKFAQEIAENEHVQEGIVAGPVSELKRKKDSLGHTYDYYATRAELIESGHLCANMVLHTVEGYYGRKDRIALPHRIYSPQYKVGSRIVYYNDNYVAIPKFVVFRFPYYMSKHDKRIFDTIWYEALTMLSSYRSVIEAFVSLTHSPITTFLVGDHQIAANLYILQRIFQGMRKVLVVLSTLSITFDKLIYEYLINQLLEQRILIEAGGVYTINLPRVRYKPSFAMTAAYMHVIAKTLICYDFKEQKYFICMRWRDSPEGFSPQYHSDDV